MPFPQLSQDNPAPDPGGFASAAASFHNALQSAANQMATQKRLKDAADVAQAQRDFENKIQLLKLGAEPDADTGSTHPNGPTLKLGDKDQDSARAERKGTTIKDPQGGPDQYIPTKAEIAAKTPGNFVPRGQLAEALKSAGWDGKTSLTAPQSHSLMQALNLAQPKDETYSIDTSGKFTDAQGKPAAVTIGHKTGKVRMLDLSGVAQPSQPGAAQGGPFAQSVSPGDEIAAPNDAGSPGYGLHSAAGAQPGGAFSFAPPEKAAKPPKNLHFVNSTNDAGDVVTRGFDPETGELKSTKVEKGIGPKRRDPDAGPREKPPSPAQFRMVVSAKAKALKSANDAYAKAVAPVGGAGGIAATDQEKAEALKNLRQAHVQAQNDYEEGIGTLTGNDVPHNDWADKALAEATAQPPDAEAKQTPGRGGKAAQPAAAPAAKPAAVAAKTEAPPPEGTIVRNPKTGERRQLKGGKWTPISN